MSSIVAMVSAVRNDRGQQLLQCVPLNWLCAPFTESCPLFLFPILASVFLDESSGRKSFRFWSKFYVPNSTFSIYTMLLDELNIAV